MYLYLAETVKGESAQFAHGGLDVKLKASFLPAVTF